MGKDLLQQTGHGDCHLPPEQGSFLCQVRTWEEEEGGGDQKFPTDGEIL